MITALLVDDEPASFLRLRRLLESYPEIRVIGTEVNFSGAKHFLSQQKPDLIFLDVEIPGGLGTDLLPFVDPSTGVIFITAHDNYAVKAFEGRAIDYLLKPINPERLEKSMQRVRELFLKKPVDQAKEALSVTPEFTEALELKLPGSPKTVFVSPSSILWIESMQNYSQIKLVGEASPIVIRRTLNEWEEILSPEKFHRLGRTLIIQLDLLRWTEWRSRDEVLLSFQGSAEPLVIGRMAAARLKEIRKEPR
jgi:two-component system LytT family response regulator